MRRVIVMGAAGRDFHVFNTVFRDDPGSRVVAFTAAQIPGIDDRTYPPELAGPAYPDGIPIRPEAEIEQLIEAHAVDEVVFAYSDLPHVEVMHVASRVLAAGADFTFVGPKATMLESTRPVVAVVASRTGCGKSQTSRVVAGVLRAAGLRVGWVRHPMPYGDLAAMAVQRFASRADLAAAALTVEELESTSARSTTGSWSGRASTTRPSSTGPRRSATWCCGTAATTTSRSSGPTSPSPSSMRSDRATRPPTTRAR